MEKVTPPAPVIPTSATRSTGPVKVILPLVVVVYVVPFRSIFVPVTEISPLVTPIFAKSTWLPPRTVKPVRSFVAPIAPARFTTPSVEPVASIVKVSPPTSLESITLLKVTVVRFYNLLLIFGILA